MATKANVRVKKKVKKNVAEGIAHIHASFNNTIITMHYLGQHLAALDLKAREKVHLLQRKLQLRQQVKRLKSVV